MKIIILGSVKSARMFMKDYNIEGRDVYNITDVKHSCGLRPRPNTIVIDLGDSDVEVFARMSQNGFKFLRPL